jgi:hypothetical protein
MAICSLAAMRAAVALRTVNALVPDTSPRMKKRLANKILSLCDGCDRSVKITEPIAREMVLRNSQCLQSNCPAFLFTEPLVRELNAYFAEEDQ